MSPLRRLSQTLAAAVMFFGVTAFGQTTNYIIYGPGAGLDLEGAFPYAIQFSTDGPRTLSSLTFSNYTAVSGLGISTHFQVNNWGTKPEFGNSTDDNTLEDMMFDIAYNNGTLSLTLSNLTVGEDYKLQLLFSENFWQGSTGRRSQSIDLEGGRIVTNLDTLLGTSWTTAPNTHTGIVLVSHIFTAGDSVLNLDLMLGTVPGTDGAPLIGALTLELIPEANGLLFIGFGVCGALLINRRRRR